MWAAALLQGTDYAMLSAHAVYPFLPCSKCVMLAPAIPPETSVNARPAIGR